MRETFASLEALGAYLRTQQEMRAGWTSFRLLGQRTDAQLHQALDMLLPMVQRSSRRIWRERNGHTVTMTLSYREGVRLADAYRCGNLSGLSDEETAALAKAEALVRRCESLQALQDELVRSVAYENPHPGSRRYSRIVGCVSVLTEGRGNCQGISDAMYLLGTLAGERMGYQLGWNPKGLHLWNTVCRDGRWVALDATHAVVHGAGKLLLDRGACRECGLRWERWAETACIAGD